MTIAMTAAHSSVLTISQNSLKAPEALRDISTSLLDGTKRRERRLARPRGIKPAGAGKVKELAGLARGYFRAPYQCLGQIIATFPVMARLGLAIHEFRGARPTGGSANSWIPRPSFGMTEYEVWDGTIRRGWRR